VSVTEVKQALGSWSLQLRDDTPRELLDQIGANPFGHIAIVPGKVDPVAAGDGLLTSARYVGVYRHRRATTDGFELSGAGMAFWLGDEDGKGAVLVAAATSLGATFAQAVTSVVPTDRLTVGTIYSIPGSGTWTHSAQYQTCREALTYITDSYSTDTVPVSWRVNGNGTVDAGRDVDLFVTTPKALLVRKDSGRELQVTGLAGTLETEQDVEDYTTNVFLLAQGEGSSTVTASASAASSYLNLKGNAVQITRLVSEYETEAGNATARAQLQLNRFTSPRKAVALSTDEFDVKGTFSVGDTISVYDPDTGFVDTSREVSWKGQPINPAALPVTELTWPIPDGWTVAFRTGAGTWLDLSRYYEAETGATTVVVGGVSRSLTEAGQQPVGSRPVPDTSTPNTPTFSSFTSSTYQTASGNGETRGQVQLVWNLPTNTDGSTVTDGGFYTIRWRPNVSAPYPATHQQMSGYLHSQIQTHAQPLISPILSTAWMYTVVPWGTNQVLVQELTPGVTYEFQINAGDAATPANVSPFSATQAVPVAIDFFPPSQPAAPVVAGNNNSIQVTHTLGRASGGTYNLDSDLHHLEVHVGGDTSFFPDATTKVGDLVANSGLLRAALPAIATFPIQQLGQVNVKVVAVDRTGNKSDPSPAAQVTALLLGDAYISDLSVSKVTAGSVTAEWVMAGAIRTSTSGQRAEMTSDGFKTWNAAGINTFRAGYDGIVTLLGELSSGVDGRRIVVNPAIATTPAIRFYPDAGGEFASLFVQPTEVSGETEAWLIMRSSYGATTGTRLGTNPYQASVGSTDLNGNWLGGQLGARADLIQAQYWPTIDNPTSRWVLQDQYAAIGTYDAVGDGLANGMAAYAAGAQFGNFAQDGTFTTGLDADDANGFMRLTGKFLNNGSTNAGATDAAICGSVSTGGAVAEVTILYGPTMASTPNVVSTPLRGAAGAVDQHYQRVNNTTGFTQRITAALQCSINYWAFRT
jgi:hypothetical protein